jgi:tRNA threonylcarbamoyladenosine biosynthesis protein TsaE
MTRAVANETVCRSRSPEETMALARSLAETYPEGACFHLEGDLGAGKTLYAKGIASAYGVDPNLVVSPTFALVNRYTGARRAVYHIDLYRIDNERELVELGLDELEELEETKPVMIVEWPEKLGRYRRSDAVVVRLETADDESRTIRILSPL